MRVYEADPVEWARATAAAGLLPEHDAAIGNGYIMVAPGKWDAFIALCERSGIKKVEDS